MDSGGELFEEEVALAAVATSFGRVQELREALGEARRGVQHESARRIFIPSWAELRRCRLCRPSWRRHGASTATWRSTVRGSSNPWTASRPAWEAGAGMKRMRL